jgi:hypothetical protein
VRHPSLLSVYTDVNHTLTISCSLSLGLGSNLLQITASFYMVFQYHYTPAFVDLDLYFHILARGSVVG